MDAARTRGKRQVRPYSGTEQRRRAAIVAAHRARFGDWCPGWGVPAHGSADLTADHVVPVALGGAESGDLGVLCRRCNARKAARAVG